MSGLWPPEGSCAHRHSRLGALFGVFAARWKTPRPGLLYCGDDQDSKDPAARLIRDIGFDPVDAGPLRVARYTEPFALLMAELAYQKEASPDLGYRFVHFPS